MKSRDHSLADAALAEHDKACSKNCSIRGAHADEFLRHMVLPNAEHYLKPPKPKAKVRTEWGVQRQSFGHPVMEMTGTKADVDDFLKVMDKHYPDRRAFLTRVKRKISDWEEA